MLNVAKQDQALLQNDHVLVPSLRAESTSTVFALTPVSQIVSLSEDFACVRFLDHHSILNNILVMTFMDLDFSALSWHLQVDVNVYQEPLCNHSKN